MYKTASCCTHVTSVIDIIIPNYNGAAHLPTCLTALRSQTRRDFRITIVDDGSTDDSRELLARSYPEVHVLALLRNQGFIAAVNTGIAATSGEYVVLLNNDTEAHPRWLEYLIGALERFPQFAFAASKLLLFDQRDHLHSAGDYYRADGVPGNRGVWQQDRGQYDTMEEVFGPCAGAAAYRRTALNALAEAGTIFDQDLVMYCEDVDLNVRAQVHGLRTIYVPQAVVYHRLSATGGGALASYYCGRNFMLVWVKNMPEPIIRRYWPALLWSQLGFALHSLWHIRESAARARLSGQVAGLRTLPQFLRKRRRMENNAASITTSLQPPPPVRMPSRLNGSEQALSATKTSRSHMIRPSSSLRSTPVSTNAPLLSVVIPAYNEEQRLPHTLEQILAYLGQQPDRSEILVADDGSTDGTAQIVERFAARHSDVSLLRLDHRGKGFTARAGALAARGEYVLLCDADLAVPIEEWPKLQRYLDGGYGVAIGSREGLGSKRLGEPWYRHVMGRVFNLIVQVVAVGGIQDTQCGFKALRREVAADLFQRMRIYGDDAPIVQGAAVTAYDVELLFLARKRGYRIAEVPVLWRYGTETKVDPLRDSLRNLRDVLRVRWNALRGAYRHGLNVSLPVDVLGEPARKD